MVAAMKKNGRRFAEWFKAFKEKTVHLIAGMSTTFTGRDAAGAALGRQAAQ
jgi:hypothetical protein